MPHMVNMFGDYVLEEGTAAEDALPELDALGFATAIRPLTSGLQGITITPDRLIRRPIHVNRWQGGFASRPPQGVFGPACASWS
jgi:hypothetical protein